MGKRERAPAAAFIGLFVASQFVEGACLAEQCPNTLAIQAQGLLTVLQCLLIQALRRQPDSLMVSACDPWDGKQPHFPAEEQQGVWAQRPR